MVALFVYLAFESECKVDGHVIFSFYLVFRLWHYVHGVTNLISSIFRYDNFTLYIPLNPRNFSDLLL